MCNVHVLMLKQLETAGFEIGDNLRIVVVV